MDITSAKITYLPDGTVNFLPVRLNRQPVVVLGLTADEMFLTAGISAAVGVLVGGVIAVAAGEIAIVPTALVVTIGIGVFTGGRLLRRLKRGRPETWLYRQLQWRVVNQLPLLTTWVGGRDLINRSGIWSHRRDDQL